MRYLLIFLFLSGCSLASAEEDYFDYDGIAYHELIVYSLNYLGYDEYENRKELKSLLGVDPVRTEWCAAFVNYILEENGYPTSESVHEYPLLARSFTEYGMRVNGEPMIGDIVVLSRGTEGWQGHVGFYLGTVVRDGKVYYGLISGNDDDRVTVDIYPVGRVIAIRRAI